MKKCFLIQIVKKARCAHAGHNRKEKTCREKQLDRILEHTDDRYKFIQKFIEGIVVPNAEKNSKKKTRQEEISLPFFAIQGKKDSKDEGENTHIERVQKVLSEPSGTRHCRTEDIWYDQL